LRRRPGLLAGAVVVAAVSLLAVAGIEWGDPGRSLLNRSFLDYTPGYQDRSIDSPAPPGGAHLLGTDFQGRDLLSRLLHGARISVFVGVTAEAIALACGLLIGAAAGYAGGRIDAILMRGTDVLLALPAPLLAMGAMVVFEERSLVLVFMVLGLLGWGSIARLVRGEILSLREREFTEAARALGASGGRITFRHLLPHAMVPALVIATVGIAGNILTEAWLSFLGISARPPTPTWGNMIAAARGYIESHPMLPLLPGLALAITAGGFFMLADGLQKALDPKMKWRG
jgi:ABC-type dipeptide/oligopeptide/nickel transport system permease subunit